MPESVSELSLSVCLLSLYNVSVCLSVYQQNSLGIGIPISRKAYRAPMWQAASDHRYQHHLQSSTSLLPPSLHHRGPRSKFNKAIAYLFGNQTATGPHYWPVLIETLPQTEYIHDTIDTMAQGESLTSIYPYIIQIRHALLYTPVAVHC